MPPEIQNAVNLLTLESVNVTLDRLMSFLCIGQSSDDFSFSLPVVAT